MKYKAEVKFKHGPAFEVSLTANCSEVAKSDAIGMAKRCGYGGKVQKVFLRVEK